VHVVQSYHHVLWIRQHWKVDGIVGGTALFAIAYSILNAVQNKRLNSRVFNIISEHPGPISEQEISRLLNIPLARLQQRVDSLFGSGLIQQVTGPHWQDRAQRGWRPREHSTASPGG
jgi:hypothetical protein